VLDLAPNTEDNEDLDSPRTLILRFLARMGVDNFNNLVTLPLESIGDDEVEMMNLPPRVFHALYE
jgi:hypothetical protein